MTKKKGFTLIEITIAIAFISILLLTITLVVNDIIKSYRKGAAMKSVNSTGLDLIDEFTSTISEAPSVTFSNFCEYYSDSAEKDRCNNDRANLFTFQRWKASVRIKDLVADVPVYGAFCTGKYSYLWNTGYALNSNDYQLSTNPDTPIPKATLTYHYQNDIKTAQNFRLLKIADSSRMVCMANLVDLDNSDRTYSINNSTSFDISETIFGSDYILAEEPAELISSDGRLALYDLTVFPPAQDTTSKRLFYSASMILATISGGVNITAPSDYCSPATNNFLEFDNCAINKFNFAMRATGE